MAPSTGEAEAKKKRKKDKDKDPCGHGGDRLAGARQ